MANKYKPHVVILPEDEANRSIANGFQSVPGVNQRALEVLREAGGWTHVRDQFQGELTRYLGKYPAAVVVLLVDFDEEQARRTQVIGELAPSLTDRVFVLGTWSEPEALKRDLGSFESIGRLLCKDCLEGTTKTWDHQLLGHNAPELARLNRIVRPILIG